MSISRMTQFADLAAGRAAPRAAPPRRQRVARRAREGGAGEGRPAAPAAAPPAAVETKESPLSKALDVIAAYIPTEVIGVYVAVIGLLPPTSSAAKWGAFALGVVLCIFFVWIGYTAKSPGKLIGLIVIAVVAFAAWATALPGTPATDLFGDDATRVGAVAVIVLAAVLPPLGKRLGLRQG